MRTFLRLLVSMFQLFLTLERVGWSPRDIEQVLERKPEDLEEARKVRSKELILQLPESH